MKKIIFVVLLLGINAFGQQKFEIKNAPSSYNIRLEIEKCDADGRCAGQQIIRLFRKNQSKPFQIIKLPNTIFYLNESKQLPVNYKQIPRDRFSVIYFEDYNFDGLEDLAVQDGYNGGYAGPSYQIYLFSNQSKKFIRSAGFTRLGQSPYFGMFGVDYKKKIIRTFYKSSCCMHYLEEYKVSNNRLKKVTEINEYYNFKGDGMTEIETKKLINGKWRTWVKKVKREE